MKGYLEKNQNTATKEKENKNTFTTMPGFYQSMIFISINHRLQISSLKHQPRIKVYPRVTFTLVSEKYVQSCPADDGLYDQRLISLSHRRLHDDKFKQTRKGVSDVNW